MEKYVDGFVITMPKKNLKLYKKMADDGAKLWKKYGALSYFECIGDDLKSVEKWGGLSFLKMTKAKEDEIVVFSFIVYKSKKDRDKINAKIMNDPDMEKEYKNMKIFDMKKMAFGGFKPIVEF